MFIRLIAALVLALLAPLSAGAGDWKDYSLRTTNFAVPQAWYQTMDMREEELDFVSPDERFKLWARWWFPDEPLLGYPDIVSHEELTIAGQPALFIHSELAGERILELAFLTPDAKGDQFLFQLIAQNTPLAEHRAMFDQLLARLRLDGVPAKPGREQMPPTQAPAPHPEAESAPVVPRQPVTAGPGKKPSAAAASNEQHPAPQAPQPASEPASDSSWAAVLKTNFGNDCDTEATTRQMRRMLGILQDAGADVTFTLSCQHGRLPVFAVTFPFDQQGATEDYFHPLYDKLLLRNGDQPFALFEVRDHLLTQVSLRKNGEIDLNYKTLQWPEAAGSPSQPAPMAQTTQPGVAPSPGGKTRKADPRATPSEQVEAPTDRPSQQQEQEQHSGPIVLFDGNTLQQFTPFAHVGADFAAWVSQQAGTLALTIPDGQNRAKLGIQTKNALVSFPSRNDRQATRLSFTIDADQSNTFVMALTPADKADLDPWESFDLRLLILRLDDGSAFAQLRHREDSNTYDMRFPWPKGQVTFDVILRPDQGVELRNQASGRLGWAALDQDYSGRNWILQTYVAEGRRTTNTRLNLARIALDTVQAQPLPPIDALTQGPRKTTIFDGQAVAPVWANLSNPASAAHRFSTLQDGALNLSWPQSDTVKTLGIYSNGPILWLDHFGKNAVARITVSLDGSQTGDFTVGFHSRFGLPENRLGGEACMLNVTQQETGYQVVLAGSEGQTSVLDLGTVEAIPDQFTFVLTPRGISVLMAGTSAKPTSCRWLKDGTGLRLWAYATGRADGRTGLTLKQIDVNYSPGIAPATEPAVSDLPALPVTTLFTGESGPEWTKRDIGDALFANLAEQTPQGITLSRRPNPPSGNRIALVSAEPVVNLDYRIAATPFETKFWIRPDDPDMRTRIYFSESAANVEKTAVAALTLESLDGPNRQGGLKLTFHTGHFHYDHWSRTLNADWRKTWDGNFTIGFDRGQIYILMGQDKILSAQTTRSGEHRAYFAAVTPGGLYFRSPGRVTLNRVEAGWKTPLEMRALDRLYLSEDSEFSAQDYVDLLAREVVAPH